MLVYASTKSGFIEDVNADSIDEKILASFRRHLGQSAASNEVRSWRNSMFYMRDVLKHDEIPPDAGAAIEFTLPNQEFVLIDDQKLVFETARSLALRATVKDKHVLIVDGGPGTGKSVVAINLLSRLTQEGLLAQFVSKNAAPRDVFHAKLTGSMVATRFKNLFKGSGSYTNTEKHFFDALIVDEAHRLNEKSGLYQNLGENQIKEIIEAAKFSIFFVDEDQRVTLNDIGTIESIVDWARKLGATVHRQELQSQFRCNGSDGYLAWVDHTLGIKPTANPTLEQIDYDFRVFDSPHELRKAIIEKNQVRNRARMVAGYCWEWASKADNSAMDVVIPEHDFAMKWNLAGNTNLWIIRPDSVDEIGCIHTCQGLETDYIGVIIGPDLVVRDGMVVTDGSKRARADASIKGFKKMMKSNPEEARRAADLIIKNTYRTLMTRGMKGCYVFCTDKETNAWLKAAGSHTWSSAIDVTPTVDSGVLESEPWGTMDDIPLKIVALKDVRPFVNAVPLYDLKIAAGPFSDNQLLSEWAEGSATDPGLCRWVELPDAFRIKPGQFVAQVVGQSMNRRIPNGAWCLFNLNPGGTRQGKVVLAQHRQIEDPDTGGHYTIKVYRSEKRETAAGSWEHTRITLMPDSDDSTFKPMLFEAGSANELRIVAELIAVLT